VPLVPQNLRMLTFFDPEFTDCSPALFGLGLVVSDGREDYMPYQTNLIGHDSKGRSSVELPGRPPKADGNEEAS
jgi:hypothetical protein